MLQRVGLEPELLTRHAHELSGGQCQRVAIARAMILRPALLVCDEPVSALDVCVQAQIMRLLVALKSQQGMCVLFVSHDLGTIRELCDRVLVLYAGTMLELAPTESLMTSAAHPYTRALLDALPSPDRGLQRERLRSAVLAPHPQVAAQVTGGCVYRARCLHSIALCSERDPVWEAGRDPTRRVACHRWREL